jgi:hypothetical protein
MPGGNKYHQKTFFSNHSVHGTGRQWVLCCRMVFFLAGGEP